METRTFMADKNTSAALAVVLSAVLMVSCTGMRTAVKDNIGDRQLYSNQSGHPEYYDALVAGAKTFHVRVSGARGAIVSHSLLAGEHIAGLFASLAESRKNTVTKTVVIIGQDHSFACRYPLAAVSLPWKTDTRTVEADTGLIEDLISGKLAYEDAAPFMNDQSVTALVPFAARFFPDARIVPLLFGLSSSYDDAVSLAVFLRENLGDDGIVIVSTDFSRDHLPKETAENDARSFYMMKRLMFEPSSDLCRQVECDNRRGICSLYYFIQPLCLSADYLSHSDSSMITGEKKRIASYFFVVFGNGARLRNLP
jgi:AmmeMemoRadiSam system protein B